MKPEWNLDLHSTPLFDGLYIAWAVFVLLVCAATAAFIVRAWWKGRDKGQ